THTHTHRHTDTHTHTHTHVSLPHAAAFCPSSSLSGFPLFPIFSHLLFPFLECSRLLSLSLSYTISLHTPPTSTSLVLSLHPSLSPLLSLSLSLLLSLSLSLHPSLSL